MLIFYHHVILSLGLFVLLFAAEPVNANVPKTEGAHETGDSTALTSFSKTDSNMHHSDGEGNIHEKKLEKVKKNKNNGQLKQKYADSKHNRTGKVLKSNKKKSIANSLKSSSNKKLKHIMKTIRNYSGISLELNYGVLPAAFTGMFLKKTHSLSNKSFALSFIWDAKNVKIYVKGLFWKMDYSGENWLANGHDWRDTAFVELENISFIGAELFLEGNVKITDKLDLIYGAGLGGGVFQGNIKVFKAQGCNEGNWRTPDTNPEWGGCYHNPDDYDVTKVDFPAGMPVLEAKAGLFYRLNRNWAVSGYSGLLFPGFLNVGLSVSFWF